MRNQAMTIRAAYFSWLYHQAVAVNDEESPLSYSSVCLQMHSIHFNDSVSNDSNRSADGIELRNEFVATLPGIEASDYTDLHSIGKATLLEVFVALARRAEGIIGSLDAREWFSIFLTNLRLKAYCDPRYTPRDQIRVGKILHTMNDRTYSPSGKGGLFPLERPREDQRKMELWHQMSAFMNENRMY